MRRTAFVGLLLLAGIGGILFELPDPASAAKADKREYNLIPMLKIVHDGFHKYWRRENGIVTPLATRPTKDFYPLAIHVQPPEEYDFIVAVECDDQTPSRLTMVCPTAKGTVDFTVGSDGFSFVGGGGLPHDSKSGTLAKGSHHLLVQVRRGSVTGLLDDAKLGSFDPNTHPLNKPDALVKGFEDKELGLAAGANVSSIGELRLKEAVAEIADNKQGESRAPSRMNRRVVTGAPEEGDSYAGAAAPTDIVPGTTPRVSEIRGLVVMQAGDGAYHGKAIDIIATTWQTTAKGLTIIPLGTMGREMRISLEEAKRLLSIRHPELSGRTVQISFGDKYSPMDGGSAGTAFSILLLSAAGDFQIDPAAALTGDITVDGKIRTVGEVPAKVHGAALDKCAIVSIPVSNVSDMDDAILLQGPSAMWETQIFSADTLDAAIANVRKDHPAKMAAAMKLFDELRPTYETKPPSSLSEPAARERLQRIIELAPNHVSAINLLRLAQGNGPTHLTTIGSVERGLIAIGVPCQMSLFMQAYDPSLATAPTITSEQEALAKVRKIADPATEPFLKALDQFLTAYRQWAAAKGTGRGRANSEARELNSRADAARAELMKLGSSSQLIDSMLHK